MITDKDTFAADNFNLIYKFLSLYNLNYLKDDVIDILFIGYTKAINKYDPTKGQFSTFAFNCMLGEYKDYMITKNRHMRNNGLAVISLNSPVSVDSDSAELIDFIVDDRVNIEESVFSKISYEELIALINKVLTKTQQAVFIDYYINNLNISEIAKKRHISKQAVSLSKKQSIKRIHKTIEKIQKYLYKGD